MKITHEKLGIEIELAEIKTRNVEAWFRAQAEYGPTDNKFIQASNMVRAAVKAKMIPEFDVDGAEPAAVAFLAMKIDVAVAEALTIPPE